MTLRELFEFYKTGISSDEKIVLCNYKTQDGFEINNVQQFKDVIEYFGETDIFLMNKVDIDDGIYMEYFIMEKVEPYIAVLRHPELTNAYFKETPDKILSVHASESGIYHYILVDYKNLIKDLVIELPETINDNIWKVLRKKFPQSFKKNETIENSSFSIVFTNSDRFKLIEQFSFKLYSIDKIFPDIKTRHLEVASKRLWKEILKVDKN